MKDITARCKKDEGNLPVDVSICGSGFLKIFTFLSKRFRIKDLSCRIFAYCKLCGTRTLHGTYDHKSRGALLSYLVANVNKSIMNRSVLINISPCATKIPACRMP
jgi:hypothetical protein